jgi:hypothetical protein
LISCGTGAGKTICGLAEDLSWALNNEGIIGYIFEPSFPMVRRILIPTLETDWLLGKPIESNPAVVDFNRSEMRLELMKPKWHKASVLWFASLEDPERAEGPNIDFAHVDEARLVRNFDLSWKVILRRLRGSNTAVPYPRGAWVTTTPDQPGSDLFNFFENPVTKNPNSKVYRWSIYENPKLPKDYIADIERTHTGGLSDRFIYGRFAMVGGGSLPFDSSKHVRDILIAHLNTVRYGVDFGWTNPTAAVAIGYDSDSRVYVLNEFYKTHADTTELIEQLQEWYKDYGRGEILCDPSSPETIEMLCRANLDASGYKFKRADGLRELGTRFLKAGDGQPRIFISSKCVNLISEVMEYKENVKERDHAVDALRYSLVLEQTSDLEAYRFG